MNISDNLKKLCNNINLIIDPETNIKYTGNFKPVLYKHKYSSQRGESLRIDNDGEILPNRFLQVSYTCPNCGSENKILLKRFLAKTTLRCKKCLEDEDKRKKQSEYIKKSMEEFGKIIPKQKQYIKKFKELTSQELIEISNKEFSSESEEFKLDYFKRNPTFEEFEKLRNKIKIGNLNMNKIIFYPHIKTNHSTKYSPKVLDENGNFHLLYNVKFLCDSCGHEFEGRYFKQRASNYKVLCRDCNLSNNTFKIKQTTNIKGEKVIYQSNPELELIEYCELNSILIQNGPKIEYNFKGKKLRYKVDFKIKNILIEIKDNHVWHRNEVKSGKWSAKENAAREYCKKNNLEYKLIMMSDIKNLKDNLLK